MRIVVQQFEVSEDEKRIEENLNETIDKLERRNFKVVDIDVKHLDKNNVCFLIKYEPAYVGR